MYLVQGIHPHVPGCPQKHIECADKAAIFAKELVEMIGNDMARGVPHDPEWVEGWNIAKRDDWTKALAWLKSNCPAIDVDPDSFDVSVDDVRGGLNLSSTTPPTTDFIGGDSRGGAPEGTRRAVADAIADAIAGGVLKDAPAFMPGLGFTGREAQLHEALGLALGHVEHMAGFIGRLKAGYSFESLGEDYSQMREALEALPISHHAAKRVARLGAQLAEDEPLPVALAMIDQIINNGGEDAALARAGKKALAQIVYAGVELHAELGSAIEQHVYDFDNGDEVPADCTLHAAMRRWADVMRGDPMVYAQPASPLPWRAVITQRDAYLVDAKDAGTGICIYNADEKGKRDILAVLDAINAQPSLTLQPEVAVIVEDGIVQNVLARASGGAITVHVVDYDTEGADTEKLVQIPGFGGGTAPAVVSTWARGDIDEAIEGEAFWHAVKTTAATTN